MGTRGRRKNVSTDPLTVKNEEAKKLGMTYGEYQVKEYWDAEGPEFEHRAKEFSKIHGKKNKTRKRRERA